ncbi:MAG: ADOP family duplicated permease [Gemmatimonadaceae bacterium]
MRQRIDAPLCHTCMLDAFEQDLRYAVRGLRSKPGFATAVIVTLSLGIGANAAMFGIVDRLLFRPPPMMIDPATAHRVYVTTSNRGTERSSPPNQYARIADLTHFTSTLSTTAAFTLNDLAVGIGDAAREMKVGLVTASFFGFFDAPPAIGRYFSDAEDLPPAGTPVAVASYATWQTQYGGRSDIIGSKVQIGSVLFTVVGVSPRGFVGMWETQPPAYYVPVTVLGYARAGTFLRGKEWWKTYSWGWLQMIARRKPGVSVERASADLTQAFVRSYQQQLVGQTRSTPIALARPRALAGSILSERGPNQTSFTKVATWVSGVALIVLLVACANVANLLLARAIRRRREVAVRLALGVSRARLFSQLLIESMLLAGLGGVGGILVAQWGGAALRAGLMPQSASVSAFSDGRTLLFTASTALVVGLLTGLAPVIQSGSVNLTGDLKSGAREGTLHRSRTRVALLLLQGALSLVLLVGAGLFVRSLRNVQSLRIGYDTDQVAIVNLNMRGVKLDSAQTVALRFKLLDHAKTVPGVENASLQTSIPFWSMWSVGLYVEGIDTVGKIGQFNLNAVSPEFFSTLGTRIIRGRGFTNADVLNAPRAMVVSEAMGKALWPGKDAIGQCIRVNADTLPCTYVVGIAENIKDQSLSDDPGFYYYLPALQFSPQSGGLFVRTHGSAAPHLDAIRRELQRDMPPPAYVSVTPFSDVVGGQTKSWRLGATMFVAFGVLALALAAIGLYSVIAYNVAQRTHEMGVRVALGAQSSDVVRLVVTQGVKLGASGVAIGAAIALASATWIKPLLFSESPRDPAVFAIVTVTLLVITVAASWVPARRAARVDPNEALRTE